MFVKIAHNFGVRLGRPDIESSSKQVACVETYSYSTLVLDKGDNAGEVLESGTDDIAACICL